MSKIERNDEYKLSESELDTVIGGAATGFRYYEMNGDTYASNGKGTVVRVTSNWLSDLFS